MLHSLTVLFSDHTVYYQDIVCEQIVPVELEKQNIRRSTVRRRRPVMELLRNYAAYLSNLTCVIDKVLEENMVHQLPMNKTECVKEQSIHPFPFPPRHRR